MLEGIVYSNKDKLSAGIIVAGWDKVNGGTVYNIPLGGGLFKGPWAIGGSGSTYIYGYCDATYREDWGRDETVEFVKNALALAMSRDGSSGGTIRLAIITEDGVERVFVPGDQLPTFWEKVAGLPNELHRRWSGNSERAIGVVVCAWSFLSSALLKHLATASP
ncbi:uncharacterized protein JCM10292_006166 [Rhodotorula paludigena]|uniref:uncharacterized protein n=1 Tax=Rhodotorula paludigena TaxID=86838 RepID=UPI00317C7868